MPLIEPSRPPTDETLKRQAGSAGRGRILIRGDLDRVSLGVVDTNGDGAMLVELVMHQDDDGVWRESAWNSAALYTSGWVHGVAYAYGRTAGVSSVSVTFRGREIRVAVNAESWWLYLGRADEHDMLPALAGLPT